MSEIVTFLQLVKRYEKALKCVGDIFTVAMGSENLLKSS
jgi:hypothetical protein